MQVGLKWFARRRSVEGCFISAYKVSSWKGGLD